MVAAYSRPRSLNRKYHLKPEIYYLENISTTRNDPAVYKPLPGSVPVMGVALKAPPPLPTIVNNVR